MTALGSLFPNNDVQKGSWLNTSGGTTGDYFALVDEEISSANDADYVRCTGGNDDNLTSEYLEFDLTNTPSDFVGMSTLNYNVRYRQFNRNDDTLNLSFRVETSTGTALTNTVTISGITTTSFTSTGSTAFTLTTDGESASKSDWDSAIFVMFQRYTSSMSNDNAYIAVSAIELTGDYAAATTVSRTASSSGTGSSIADDIVTKLRTADASGTGSSTANGIRVVLRTASSSGSGSGTATKVITNIRTASSSGTGSSSASGVVTRVRTASSSGSGSSVAIIPGNITRTASASGTGSSVVVSARLLTRNATSSGVGTGTGDWLVAVVATAASTGTGSSSIVFVRTLVRTIDEMGQGSSVVVSGRAVNRTAEVSGQGSSPVVLWTNPGKPINGFIVIKQKNSVGFSKNDPRDQRIFFKRQ